jgi:hypothetical protein
MIGYGCGQIATLQRRPVPEDWRARRKRELAERLAERRVAEPDRHEQLRAKYGEYR